MLESPKAKSVLELMLPRANSAASDPISAEESVFCSEVIVTDQEYFTTISYWKKRITPFKI